MGRGGVICTRFDDGSGDKGTDEGSGTLIFNLMWVLFGCC